MSAISLGDWMAHDGHVVGSCLLIKASLKSGIKYLCKEDTPDRKDGISKNWNRGGGLYSGYMSGIAK